MLENFIDGDAILWITLEHLGDKVLVLVADLDRPLDWLRDIPKKPGGPLIGAKRLAAERK